VRLGQITYEMRRATIKRLEARPSRAGLDLSVLLRAHPEAPRSLTDRPARLLPIVLEHRRKRCHEQGQHTKFAGTNYRWGGVSPQDDDSEQIDFILPPTTGTERTLEGLATVAEFAPELGGVVANLLSGAASKRRNERVRAALAYVLALVADVSIEQKTYVRSEDFEDLLIETLGRVESERSEEKRRAYGQLLASAVRNAGEPGYDEQLRYLRVLEELQPDHLGMLAAITQEPDGSQGGVTSSLLGTLQSRLPDMPEEHVRDLAQQLDRMALTNMGGALSAMMTARGAADLRSRLTPFGQRFVAYITDDSRG
jgi:hypothetical protein